MTAAPFIIEKQPTPESLQNALSLTKYETQVYLTLLNFESLSPQHISEKSKVPRSRCYDTLRRLEAKGMVIEIVSRPTRYQALPPSIAFENRLKQMKNELEKRQTEALRLQEHLTNVYEGRTEVEEVHTVLRIGNAPLLTKMISEDVEKSKGEVCVSMTPNPHFKSWRKIFETYSQKKNQHFSIKHLISDENKYLQTLHPVRTEVQPRIDAGNIQLRTFKGIQQPFAVFDNEISYLFFTNPTNGHIEFALRIKSIPFSKQLKQMFDLLWKEAEPMHRHD